MTEPGMPEPKSSWSPAQFIGAAWRKLASGITIARLLLALLAVGAATLLFTYAPFPPFSTNGSIFVSSPEVYTRERLVNDRYDQDFWYRHYLAQLDGATNLVSGKFTIRGSVDAAIGPGKTADPEITSSSQTGTDTPSDSSNEVAARDISVVPISFNDEFNVRSGLRDKIRQLILENMLDDRHDLTGNSIYGLKFDTTIVPGGNTHGRASIQVSASIPHPFPSSTPEEGLPSEVVRQVFGAKATILFNHPDDEIRESYNLYKAWLDSVSSRLESYARRVYDATDGGDCNASTPVDVDQATSSALASVLGVEIGKSFIKVDAQNAVSMPQPWPKFIRLHRTGGKTCDDPPKFVAVDVWGMIYVANKGAEVPPGYIEIGIETDTKVALIFSGENTSADMVSYQISADLIESATSSGAGFETCIPVENGKCIDAFAIVAPFGYFNFVKEAGKSDAYVYALLPKSDVKAVETDYDLSVGVSGQAEGWLDGLLRFGQGFSGVRAEAVQVGYGDGQGSATENGANTEVRFGWVVGPISSPTQGTQLVLLSVPAWSDELQLTVSVGWLDRDGNHRAARAPFRMTVRLPPDYEAFDSFMAGAGARPAPRILEEFMDTGDVRACLPASVLIPGSRLWRSATVTLGAQQAKRITVLPSMQGIIAEFDAVHIPNDAEKRSGSQLRVWTSEGESSAAKRIRITASDSEMTTGICGPVDKEPELTKDLPGVGQASG